jgi:hypothetical protein
MGEAMTDADNKDQSQQENSGEAGKPTGNTPPPTTSQDFEFTDSSFKRGQDTGDMQKRVIDNSLPSTVKREKGS